MKLLEVHIKNYKSIGDIVFRPDNFNVLIGPNASGKSNFASAISFLSEVYSYGLETAIRRKGGYDNIARRKQRRSKAAISFRLVFSFEKGELHNFSLKREGDNRSLFIVHEFSFKATQIGINADFIIDKEEFKLIDKETNDLILIYNRKSPKDIDFKLKDKHELLKDNLTNGDLANLKYILEDFSHYFPYPQSLVIRNTNSILKKVLERTLNNWSVYRIAPNHSRLSGVPTPNPEMDINGENLPAIVDWIKRNHPEKWNKILSLMQSVMPELDDIKTDYLHDKTLGLFFFEEKMGRAWNVNEISDGTLSTLALLCVVNDPRKSLILIEEPENSVHPWIVRNLIEHFKEVAETAGKNIILTTHSPVLIDMLYPKEIWCISKKDGVSNLNKLIDIAPEIKTAWHTGEVHISEYLDMGLVPQSIPGGTL